MARYAAWDLARQSALRLAYQRSGVVGVDYGYVYKDGKRLKTRGVRFHVRDKLPLSNLLPEEVLPKAMGKMRCDVVQASYALAASPRERCDPIEIGISIGNLERSSTGTLGLLVRDRHTFATALLSNWHVLCASVSAVVGERLGQPGPLHLGSQSPRLAAHLERWIPLSTGYDAAIGLLDEGISWRQNIFASQLSVLGVGIPKLGMRVQKFGTVSGLTHGLVDGVGGSYEIDYTGYGDTKRWMEGIRLAQDPDYAELEISLAGDSGASWTDALSGDVVALHFAGEDGLGPNAEYALAQPLTQLLALLDIDLL